MLTFCNSYVLWLLRCVQLRLVTVTFCDINIVWCYTFCRSTIKFFYLVLTYGTYVCSKATHLLGCCSHNKVLYFAFYFSVSSHPFWYPVCPLASLIKESQVSQTKPVFRVDCPNSLRYCSKFSQKNKCSKLVCASIRDGANVIIRNEMLSSRIRCYHLELILSSGLKCYHLGRDVIIWS